MKEHLENGNALLASSLVGLVVLLSVVYLTISLGGNVGNPEGHESQRQVLIGQVLVLGGIMGLAWFAVLGLSIYDICINAKNGIAWKASWMAVTLFCFFGTVIYCLVGRRSRMSNEAKK